MANSMISYEYLKARLGTYTGPIVDPDTGLIDPALLPTDLVHYRGEYQAKNILESAINRETPSPGGKGQFAWVQNATKTPTGEQNGYWQPEGAFAFWNDYLGQWVFPTVVDTEYDTKEQTEKNCLPWVIVPAEEVVYSEDIYL